MTDPKDPCAPTEKRPWIDLLKEEFETEGPRPEPRWKRVLSDEQWAELQRLSGLPPWARWRVANLIIIYRNWKDSPPDLPPAQTRSQLEQTATQAHHLFTSIDQLYDNGRAMEVLTDRHGWDVVRLDRLFAELDQFCYLLAGAHGRVQQRAKTGPSHENLLGFVHSLAHVLREKTGAQLSQSKKQHGPGKRNVAEFIIRAACLADPNLQEHTILNAIRKVMKLSKLAP